MKHSPLSMLSDVDPGDVAAGRELPGMVASGRPLFRTSKGNDMGIIEEVIELAEDNELDAAMRLSETIVRHMEVMAQCKQIPYKVRVLAVSQASTAVCMAKERLYKELSDAPKLTEGAVTPPEPIGPT